MAEVAIGTGVKSPRVEGRAARLFAAGPALYGILSRVGPLPEVCTACGARAGEGPRCPRCGASLLVDLVVQPVAGERKLFNGSRSLSALGAPAPDAVRARERLSAGGTVLASVSRDFALAASGALAGWGIRSELRPSSPLRRARAPIALAALGVLLAAAGLLWQRRHRPAPEPEAVAAAAPAAPAAPSFADIAAETLPSVVKVSCKDWLGTGFYLAPTTVLTNAHVACPPEEPVRLRHTDGTEAEGTVSFRDEWLDIARIEVRAGKGRPLRTGDPTALRAGDPVLYIGTPLGLDFSLGQGTLAFVGRNMEGIAWLQFNAPVAQGNSGGPLLDARGAVVGIVSLKARRAEGIGFALPIGYALPPAGEEALRWQALLKRVQKEDREEQAKLIARYQRPRLVGAEVRDRALWAMFIAPADVSARSGLLVEMLRGDERTCLARIGVERWDSLSVLDEARFREARWLGRGELGRSLQVMSGRVDGDLCPEVMTGDQLAFLEGVEERGRVKVESMVAWVPRKAIAGQRANARLEAQRWRRQFSDAWRSVARAEQGVAAAAQEDAGAQPAMAAALNALEMARAELIELERSASDHDIPPDWR